MEISVDDFMSVLKEADSCTMGSVYLSLPDVDNLIVLVELRIVESRIEV